ncbi:hypothetical protein BS50DRAFT_489182 [Corynespora cassiicola Philippines]|uniref:Zn(2)-C6 fungal-type domain-containing protein n=1 Tax=Corynespora cassiicola Philippines TaxID=1448308 RepID=A0A2T2NWY3_CORCC|nr:hypothetical protein BS50DRAFT_489182 [Corynespora cassiicola Philippines]
MTRAEKCDVCRSRKVKCDEMKPACGACLKGGRPCTYTYGKPSAFVLENPSQFTGYGKPKVAPLVHPIVHYKDVKSMPSSRQKLRTSKGVGAQSIEQEPLLSTSSGESTLVSTKPSSISNCLALAQPSSLQSTLVTRFIHLLGPQLENPNPFIVDGSWTHSIPARIGHSDVFDLSVGFALDCFAVYNNNTFSNQRAATISKGKALNALRASIQRSGNRPELDLLLAVKLHFYSEVFLNFRIMDVRNWTGYFFHMNGLFELLKFGNEAWLRDPEYWHFVQGTYMEEVVSAAFEGKLSGFETDFYLSATSTGLNPQPPSVFLEASTSLMHCWIQVPRLIALVREARLHPEDMGALASAVALAETIWALDPAAVLNRHFAAATKILPIAPAQEISDIAPARFEFDSIDSLILFTRYWMFHNFLCGITWSLRTSFPQQSAASLLPSDDVVAQIDVLAATNIVQSLPQALRLCESMPLLPLRIASPLQTTAGCWHRAMMRKSGSIKPLTQTYADADASCRHGRMLAWVLEANNQIHDQWGFPRIGLNLFERAQEYISGGTEWHGLFPPGLTGLKACEGDRRRGGVERG